MRAPGIAGAVERFRPAVLAGLLGGTLSSFVKWGTEVPLPPRTAERISPPTTIFRSLGINSEGLNYDYSGHIISFGSVAVHQCFSVAFGVAYCILAEIFPRVTLWQGMAFGLAVTIAFHGIILPLGGWGPPLWRLPFDEGLSELLGHLAWAWTIEIVRLSVSKAWSPDPTAVRTR